MKLVPVIPLAYCGGEEGIIGFTFVDDLIIGTRLETDAQAAMEGVRDRFLNHPAGSLVLHNTTPLKASSGKVCVLGYFIEPGNGLNGTIHVKPGPKRFYRFYRELIKRLAAAGPSEDLFAVGMKYWRRWFDSQQAWTKIPLLSENVSESIAHCRIFDWAHGELPESWLEKES